MASILSNLGLFLWNWILSILSSITLIDVGDDNCSVEKESMTSYLKRSWFKEKAGAKTKTYII